MVLWARLRSRAPRKRGPMWQRADGIRPYHNACAVFVGAAISRPPCRHSTALSVGRDDPRRAKPLAKRTLIRLAFGHPPSLFQGEGQRADDIRPYHKPVPSL